MNGVKNFAVSFCISLLIFGIIAFIIVKFMWPNSNQQVPKNTDPTNASQQNAPSDSAYYQGNRLDFFIKETA